MTRVWMHVGHVHVLSSVITKSMHPVFAISCLLIGHLPCEKFEGAGGPQRSWKAKDLKVELEREMNRSFVP